MNMFKVTTNLDALQLAKVIALEESKSCDELYDECFRRFRDSFPSRLMEYVKPQEIRTLLRSTLRRSIEAHIEVEQV